MRNKKGSFLIAIGVILVLSSAGLFGYNLIEEKNAKRSSERAAVLLGEQIIIKAEDKIYENAAETVIEDYILNPEMEMPIEEIDGTEYIGTLEIPKIGLLLPVINEWSYPNLKIAPCRYFGSVYLDNMVIAGHNYKAHFRELESLFTGDEVIFTDVDGNKFCYMIGAKEVLPPTAVEEMTAGEWDFTLFTCNATGTYRIAIRCDKIG